MAKIFLVLEHDQAVDGWVKIRGIAGEPVYHKREHRVGVGGNGHDAMCHCLVVHKQSYKTREKADEVAEELGKKYPNSFCWSLEVEEPE